MTEDSGAKVEAWMMEAAIKIYRETVKAWPHAESPLLSTIGEIIASCAPAPTPAPSDLTRYDLHYGGAMKTSETGEWVRYEDIALAGMPPSQTLAIPERPRCDYSDAPSLDSRQLCRCHTCQNYAKKLFKALSELGVPGTVEGQLPK